jgi:hypothetical protein
LYPFTQERINKRLLEKTNEDQKVKTNLAVKNKQEAPRERHHQEVCWGPVSLL